MGLLRKWGLGAELTFTANQAIGELRKVNRHVQDVRTGFGQLHASGGSLAMGLGQIGLALAPIGIGFTALLGMSSRLASDLEAQRLTFRILLRDQAKADALIASLRTMAAESPFGESELIESSKRLLRLTGQNVDENKALLETLMTLTALNPSKNLVDSAEALLDATSGGGFERFKEFGITLRAEDFQSAGKAGSKGWSDAIVTALREDLDKKVGDVDLVGALGRTFKGRLSTFQDLISQSLTGIGEVVNEKAGPALEFLATRLTKSKDEFVAGFGDMAESAQRLFDRYLKPGIIQATRWFDSLGVGTRQAAFMIAFALAGLISLVLAVGSALGVLGLLTSGVVSVLSTLWGLMSVPVLEAVAIGIALIAAAMAYVGVVVALVTRHWGYVSAAAQSFFAGVLAGFGPLDQVWAEFSPMLTALGQHLADLFTLVEARGAPSLKFWARMGYLIGTVLRYGISAGAASMRMFFGVLESIVQIAGPFLLAIQKIALAISSLFAGTATAGDVIRATFQGFADLVLSSFNAIAIVLLGFFETVLRMVEAIVTAIPGFGGLAKGMFGEQADRLAAVKRGLTTSIEGTIAGVDAADLRKRAETWNPEVNVTTGPTELKVDVQSNVQIDSEAVGRAQGKGAVRAGEKGTGPPLVPAQRGRVLRNGLEVTPLRPAEVL